MKPNDDLFKELAQKYNTAYGEELKKELHTLDTHSEYQITPRLDKKVKKGIQASKGKSFSRIIGIIAACAVLAIVTPTLLKQMQFLETTPDSAGTSSAGATERPPESSSIYEDKLKNEAYEIIPLSFTPPGGFTQTDFLQDKEKSVYTFSDSNLDDVVVTLEVSENQSFDDSFSTLEINNRRVYIKTESSYKLLSFDYNNIRYTLSCEYDLNTLINFSKNALK